MKRFGNKLCAFALIVLLIIGSMMFVSAEERTDLELYLERHGITDYYKETVDGSDYYYTVDESGNASVVHIRTNVTKSQMGKVITLPEKLGGYPVTTIGIVGDKIEVFAYYNDGEDLSVLYPGIEDPEYDPGLKYVPTIIIPEGYEYIGDLSLRTWEEHEWQFPKSLKKIYGTPLDWHCFPTTVEPSTQRNLAVLPDCQYESFDCYSFHYMFQPTDTIVLPSRDVALFDHMMSDNADGLHFYVPSNISFASVRDALFYYLYNERTDKYEWQDQQGILGEFSNYSSFHFAADSDIPEQIEALDGDNPYPMICDLPVATHIAFDSENVSVSVGEVVDLEAKTYPAEAVWTACDYVSSNPEVVKVDPYSGRITALAEGEATITATHVERGFVDTCTVKVENKPEHICTPAEKWSADETAHWLECTDPECGEIVNYAEHSGGNATVNAKAICEHCGTAYGEYASASLSVEPVSDIAYCAREKREYKITVAENADKVQFIRDSGSTTTFVRSQAAEIINNGDGTETWILAVSLNKGKYTLATKYGKVWNKNGIEFEIVFDTPKCRSFTSEKVGNLTTFTVVTDPQVAKVQLITQSGNTLTYTQSNSYIGDDGLRYWTVVRKITKPGTIGLRTKYGYTWTTTDFTIEV